MGQEYQFRNLNPIAVERARHLRKTMGQAEKRLWARLRRDNVGFRFRRQVAVGPYFLDFYCPKARVCVEVDGDLHVGQETRDSQRDDYLLQAGIYTFRVWTIALYEDIDTVLEQINHVCAIRVSEKMEGVNR